MSLQIQDEAGIKSDTLALTIDDGIPILDYPKHGAELEAFIGYQGQRLVRMGLYVVDEISIQGPPKSWVIKAKAANMRESLKAPKTRSFDNIGLTDLVTTIAAEHRLTPSVHTSLSQHFEHVDQTQESDLHLLTRLARQLGAIAKPVGDSLVVAPRSEISASGKSLPKIDIDATQVIRYRFSQSDRSRYQSVRAHWYEADSGAEHEVVTGNDKPVYTLRHRYSNKNEALQAAKAHRALLQLWYSRAFINHYWQSTSIC